jgi:hypothetical protein
MPIINDTMQIDKKIFSIRLNTRYVSLSKPAREKKETVLTAIISRISETKLTIKAGRLNFS